MQSLCGKLRFLTKQTLSNVRNVCFKEIASAELKSLGYSIGQCSRLDSQLCSSSVMLLEVPENKRRVSVLKGIVIAKRNAGLNSTFRLRRLVAGVGIESLFPLRRMPQDSPSEPDPEESDPELEFVEVDPSGRYVFISLLNFVMQYKEILGKGACKKVYRAFDELEGIEVAWNQVKVKDLLRNSVDLERLYSEVHLLKTLKHKNIIKFYNSWVDTKNEHINFITEIFTSGNLRQYRKKHKHVDVRALKKWSRQILEGLSYLHSHDPPVIHRDLKCDNIFVNGNQGEVKIGDLGLAAILQQARSAHSVIGTPEFMAPELYEEEYNELIDIYAFGMCLLELVTLEYPYVECSNAAQIYKKVTAGIRPASLIKVKDLQVRKFIEKCIANVSDRLSAKELLVDPFLQMDEDSGSRGRSLQHHSLNAEDNADQFDSGKLPEDSVLEGGRDVMVEGERKDHNTIFLKLRIADSSGHIRNIHFPFDIEVDTSTAVASEMVEELDLTYDDVSVIAEIIDSEIRSHIPDWAPREGNNTLGSSEANSEIAGSGAQDDASSPTTNESSQSISLVLERLPSGHKYWSGSPKASGESSPLKPGPSNLMPTDSVASGDSWSEENSQSPISHKDVSSSHDASPLRHVEYDSDHEYYRKEKSSSLTIDSQFSEVDKGNDVSENGLLPSEEDTKPSETDTDGIKSGVEKLEHLLNEQLRELDELKKKHDIAVSDMLKELPQEIRQRVLRICDQKIAVRKSHDKGCHSTDRSLDQSSSGIMMKVFNTVWREKKQLPVIERCIYRPVSKYGSNRMKENIRSHLGIAVILGGDVGD
ncbi:hypothetical protein RD792_004810 [Penstemon davidsonii]|uniref:non-specific serine/threonine protein kinase n=1 Tax=Penstemon davidsonii TaxID=160366 RepID=A0ABR0DIE8_9LAMI|nr:hypothetical protein RD792_004810 [Penstemon davidsonii]